MEKLSALDYGQGDSVRHVKFGVGVVKEVKKDLAPVVTQEKKEKSISEMTDAEIEEYVAKRKAALNSFTIKNEDVPMCKLIRASVVPTPQLNQQEVLRSVMYRQNKLERSMKKG